MTSPAIPDRVNVVKLVRLAELTLNGTTGEEPWVPYEETWRELAEGVCALGAEVERLREALEGRAELARFVKSLNITSQMKPREWAEMADALATALLEALDA